jgi:hypothetical protein
LKHLLVERDPNNPDKLIYTRKLQDGNGPKSYGILVCKSMDMDSEFIEMAENIRHGMSVKKDIYNVEVKTSKYNSEKIMTLCEVCQDGTIAEDVHHINQQCEANSMGIISNVGEGIFHKNNKWNLVSLCKKCHQDVHSVPIKLEIKGYIQTSYGISLKFNKLLNRNTSTDVTTIVNNNNSNNNINNNNNNNNNNTTLSSPPPYHEVVELQVINHLNQVTDSIKKQILNYKQSGKTPKKIQIELKKQNISISQKIIRDLVV